MYQRENPGKDIDKSLFTYPGPLPQNKETAVLMLIDGIEAATRSLKEKSLENIRDLIDSMDDPQEGDVYYEADAVRCTSAEGINAHTVDLLLESMDEQMYDEVGECYNNECSDVSDEAKQELRALIEAWAQKHINLSRFWKIKGKSRECRLTKEDLQ